MSKYFVKVMKRTTEECVKKIDCGTSERKAEQVERGVNINLNHDDYFTDIDKED